MKLGFLIIWFISSTLHTIQGEPCFATEQSFESLADESIFGLEKFFV